MEENTDYTKKMFNAYWWVVQIRGEVPAQYLKSVMLKEDGTPDYSVCTPSLSHANKYATPEYAYNLHEGYPRRHMFNFVKVYGNVEDSNWTLTGEVWTPPLPEHIKEQTSVTPHKVMQSNGLTKVTELLKHASESRCTCSRCGKKMNHAQ